MVKATEELAAIGTGKIANSDAAAIATFLTGIGIPADPDVISKLLVLLAVVVIECGGGISLAIGMSLQEANSAPEIASTAEQTSAAPAEVGRVRREQIFGVR